MKLFILIAALLVSTSGFSQYQIKKEWPTLATSFFAGWFEGSDELLKHHYYKFNRSFPNANQQYWNPNISWKNKYKNGDYTQGPKFPGSTTVFVWTTDAYHLVRFKRNTMFLCTFVFHPRDNRKFKYHLLDATIHSLSFSLGFNLIYGVIY